MILTVTANPLLEIRLTYKNISLGKDNRSEKENFAVGGKGINVSRQLNLLNMKNMAFTFLGGNNGKIIKNLLAEEKINFTNVQTKSETRKAAVIIEENKNRVTTFFGINSEITQNEVEEFKNKLSKMIENSEAVVFSGSSPNSLADEIFPYGIKLSNEFDRISICDTYGNHLQNCIDAAPTVIHNNVEEIESSLNISLKSEQEKIEFLKSVYEKGVKQIFLTDGKNPVYASNFGFIYKVNISEIPAKDSTGSGDAFTAGIAYSMHNALTFEETLKFSTALGILNSQTFDVCKVNLEDVKKLQEKIEVETIGKKIASEIQR